MTDAPPHPSNPKTPDELADYRFRLVIGDLRAAADRLEAVAPEQRTHYDVDHPAWTDLMFKVGHWATSMVNHMSCTEHANTHYPTTTPRAQETAEWFAEQAAEFDSAVSDAGWALRRHAGYQPSALTDEEEALARQHGDSNDDDEALLHQIEKFAPLVGFGEVRHAPWVAQCMRELATRLRIPAHTGPPGSGHPAVDLLTMVGNRPAAIPAADLRALYKDIPGVTSVGFLGRYGLAAMPDPTYTGGDGEVVVYRPATPVVGEILDAADERDRGGWLQAALLAALHALSNGLPQWPADIPPAGPVSGLLRTAPGPGVRQPLPSVDANHPHPLQPRP